MTHDELLAEIDEPNPAAYLATKITTELAKEQEDYILSAFMKVGINPQVVIEQDALINKLKAQLRAVVELHKPFTVFGPELCAGCSFLPNSTKNQPYPCETIQAIEKEMK